MENANLNLVHRHQLGLLKILSPLRKADKGAVIKETGTLATASPECYQI